MHGVQKPQQTHYFTYHTYFDITITNRANKLPTTNRFGSCSKWRASQQPRYLPLPLLPGHHCSDLWPVQFTAINRWISSFNNSVREISVLGVQTNQTANNSSRTNKERKKIKKKISKNATNVKIIAAQIYEPNNNGRWQEPSSGHHLQFNLCCLLVVCCVSAIVCECWSWLAGGWLRCPIYQVMFWPLGQ